jgi:hypothetical protein
MKINKSTFDIFVAYSHSELQDAAEVSRILESYGLNVFFAPASLKRGARVEDAIWEAMAECHAFVIVVPKNQANSWMAFELGAAKAWNKPIYAVATGKTVGPLPSALQGFRILPLSRIGEIANAILKSREAITEDEQQLLVDAYRRSQMTIDSLAQKPAFLSKIVREFNRSSGRQLSGEEAMSLLLRMRKKGVLPTRRSRSSNGPIKRSKVS